ncbi:HD domain-containing protein [Candidatus Fermentibacteria bacterium]|nr:HD domain-containing protein [Candidatus Fermentibacteria bacterium]
MTEMHATTIAASQDDLIARVMALAPLPSLTHEAHRSADALIRDLLSQLRSDSAFLSFDSLFKLVSHLATIGDPSAAESIARMSADHFTGEDRPMCAVSMLNLAGRSCYDQCAFDDAEHCFSRGLTLVPKPDVRLQTPVLLINLAKLYTEMGRFSDALKKYDEAKRIVRSTLSGVFADLDFFLPHEVVGLIVNNTGWVHLRTARGAGNDPGLLRQAGKSFDAALGLPLHPRTRLIALGNRAETYIRLNDTRKAERILGPLETECLANGHRLLPLIHGRWAQVCAARGDILSAVEWSRRALRSSLLAGNPRQELRIVEVIVDILRTLLSGVSDPLTALGSTGEPVVAHVLELLQSKDTYTGGNHSARVASLARKVACVGVDDTPTRQRWIRRVELAGLLHDMGKLCIPWSLLNKVSPLSSRDWQLLKAHTTMGKTMLESIGLGQLALVAGGHHERPDGHGYPTGSPSRRPEPAIVAAADAFEAMTSPSRVYVRPKTPSEALWEIRKASATQFRPEVVKAMVAVLQRQT